MKQNILLTLLTVILFSACSNSDYTDRYTDPSKTSKVSCEKLMTGVFKAGNTYTLSSSYRYFTFETSQIGVYTQVMGFKNTNGMYAGLGELYLNDRWKNFYNILMQYRLLEATYAKLSDIEKPIYEPFVLLSTIYMYDQLQQIVDLWGDVPFSKAGYLGITGDVSASYPSYDTAEDIYTKMLDDLGTINTKLAAITSPSALTITSLKTQDYINNGDLTLWRKYCNSLRLRMALRVSDYGSLTAKGKNVISEIFANPSANPLVENNKESIIINTAKFTVAADFNVLNEIRDGFETWGGQFNRASATILKYLENDPRLPIMYDVNGNGDYVGMSTSETESEQIINFDKKTYYSAVDSATFSRNTQMPGVILTAAEVDFMKAEIFQKGYATGDAKTAFENGITHSIELYYNINSTATFREPTAAPSAADVATFAASKWDAYSSKEEAIIVQKWLNFSLVQMVQTWHDLRRTGYPVLTFKTDQASIDFKTPPNRFKYPIDERDYNSANYSKMAANDTYTRKLFWAK